MRIAENVRLLPPANVAIPEALSKNKIIFGPEITAVLRIAHGRHQIIFGSDGEVPETLKKPHQTESDVDAIVSAAIVLTARPTEVLGTWRSLDGSARLLQAGQSCVYYSAIYDSDLAPVSRNPPEISENNIASFYEAWNKLKADHIKPLRIATQRLSQSLKRLNPVDRALDLGIAMEILLLHDVESKSETSFRFSTHGANFLGGTKTERLENQKVLKAMYACRSDAAHAGQLKKEDAARATMDKASNLAAAIAKKIVLRGGFPNWNDEFVIGND